VFVEAAMSTWNLGPTRPSVSGFVANQAFRGKLLSPIIRKNVNGVGAANPVKLEVFFNARWSAHGASDGAPHGLP